MVLGLLQHKVELLLTEVVLVALLQALTQQELVLAVEVEAVAKKLEMGLLEKLLFDIDTPQISNNIVYINSI